MARQNVDYTTSTQPDQPTTADVLDTGYTDSGAIRPLEDSEPATAAVLDRPSENLRTRTEIVRSELEALKYLSDADRALLITCTGSVTWSGIYPANAGTVVIDQPLNIKPFLSPVVSTASRLIICAGSQAQITIRTKKSGVAVPRAYSGANNFTFEFVGVNTGTGAIIIERKGLPQVHFKITYDSHPTAGTTVDQAPGNSFLQQFNADASMVLAGLEAVVEGGGTPPEVGFPTPPPVVAASKIKDFITAPEKARRYMSGAVDAEIHTISAASLAAFFVADGGTLNRLIEGDVLCIWYDALKDNSNGGRRQSLNEAPENSASIPAGSLFLLRRFPERLPYAIPVCSVHDGRLLFLNGRTFELGETATFNSSDVYPGSAATVPSAYWRDSTSLPSSSIDNAITAIVAALSRSIDPSGAKKIGMQSYVPGGWVGIGSTSVYGGLTTLVDGINSHVAEATAAHAGSAVTFPGTANGTSRNLTAGDVSGAIAETIYQLGLHEDDATTAHVYNTSSVLITTPTTTQDAIHQLDTALNASNVALTTHESSNPAHAASHISAGATTNLAASDVQTQLGQLDTQKAGLALQNTFTRNNTFTTSDTNGTPINATGNGTGPGGAFTGGANGNGVSALANGSGVGAHLSHATGGTALLIDNGTQHIGVSSQIIFDNVSGSAGIDFATSGVNVLQHYEVGSWTPSFYFFGHAPETQTSIGVYARVGKLIYLWGKVSVSTKTSVGAFAYLSGFPFNPSNTTSVALPCSSVSNFSAVGSGGLPSLIISNSGVGYFADYNGTSGMIVITDGYLFTPFVFEFTGCYRVT